MATLGETTNSPAQKLRSIIVAGASSGIGAYCAHALKAEGWRVFATARKPEDIAAACAFLVSEEAGYITGQILGVNGGRNT